MKDAERYRLDPCPVCLPYYVATRTYTARCTGDLSGESVTKTVQAKSTISEAHARSEALRLAKEQAEAELVCVWSYTSCVATGIEEEPEVCFVGTSTISFEDAQTKAIEGAWALV
jgi:hypothetical protein